MDRLTVLCFAGTYALALASDLARFVVRVPPAVERYSALALTTLGWLVHTVYLVNLAIREHSLPVTSVFESLLALAWVLAAIDLYLTARPARLTAVGPVLLALVLTVLVIAGQWAPRDNPGTGWDGWPRFWGTVHGLFLLMGAVFTCLAFVFGALYLVQTRRLKRKQSPGSGWPLPSLEQSERWNRTAITLAFPLLTAGLLIGVALVVAVHRSGGSTLAWTDPKVLSTAALWLVFAGLLHARYRPEWRGRRVMILTLVAFAFLAFAMIGVDLLLPTAHGRSTPPHSHAEARP